MMLSDVGRTIIAYADGLKIAGAERPSSWLRKLAVLLSTCERNTISDLMEYGSRSSSRSSFRALSQDDPKSCELLPHLKALESVLKAGNSPLVSDFALLIKFFESDSGYLGPMLEALRRALAPRSNTNVADFVDRLRSQIGSEAFEQTLAELESSGLKREHVIDVARAVYGGIPKSTSRKAALKFIRKPHDAHMSAKRGIEATGGRSAA